jgi:hypothetical protein
MNVRTVSVTATRTFRLGRLTATLKSTRTLCETQPERVLTTDEISALIASGAEVKAYWA